MDVAYSFPLNGHFEVIRNQALEAKSDLCEWEEVVQKIRRRFSVVNHFGDVFNEGAGSIFESERRGREGGEK